MNTRQMWAKLPFRPLEAAPWSAQSPTWREAKPAVIHAALERARARPSGNWFVVAPSTRIKAGKPVGATIAGKEVVAWRDSSGLVHVAPGACPHLGAPLCLSPQVGDRIVCHWHGLTLGVEGFPGWKPYPAHDDGALVWVRLDDVGAEPPLDLPVLPDRPAVRSSLLAVASVVGLCEPQDVVANRLDPWHGAWFHPYAFANLTVTTAPDVSLPDTVAAEKDAFVVDVAFRLPGRLGVPVRAEFTAPDPRTVVMRIVEGEGEGSIVETHATPLGPDGQGRPRTAVVEVIAATSDRPGFLLARRSAPLVRPLMEHTARRLWKDDLAYAQRRWQLRAAGHRRG